MRRLMIYVLVASMANQVLAQDGDVEAAEFVIEKNKEITLPKANRFYAPTEKREMEVSFDSLEFDIIDPKFTPTAYVPNIAVSQLEQKQEVNMPRHYARAGFGSYLSPLLEYRLTGSNDQGVGLGVGVFHESFAQGPTELDKNASSQSDTKVNLWNRITNDRAQIYSRVDYEVGSFWNYGTVDSLLSIPNIDLDIESFKRVHQSLGASIQVIGSNRSENGWYSLTPKWTLTNQNSPSTGTQVGMENDIVLDFDLYQSIGDQFGFGLTTDVGYNAYQSRDLSYGRLLAYATPSLSYHTDRLYAKAGVAAGTYNDTTDSYQLLLLPDVSASFKIDDNIAIYADIAGNVDRNTFGQIASINPHLNDSLDLRFTIEKVGAKIGTMGYLTKQFKYDVSGSFRFIDNQSYLINTELDPSMFEVVYDSGTTFRFDVAATIDYNISDHVSLNTSITYFSINPSQIEQPWHMPSMKYDLSASFKAFGSKWTITPMLVAIQGIYALDHANDSVVELPAIIDLGLDSEFNINDKFGIFLKARNLLGTPNQRFYLYDTRTFDIKGGMSFRF